jgi:hypothetical protein
MSPPVLLYSPWLSSSSDIVGDTLALSGGALYAALVDPPVGFAIGSPVIHSIPFTPGGSAEVYARVPTGVLYEGGPIPTTAGPCWFQISGATEWTTPPAQLACRTATGAARPIPGTELNPWVSSTYGALDGDVFTFFCAGNAVGSLPPCAAPTSTATWRLNATEIATGNQRWSIELPAGSVKLFTSVVVDQGHLYWNSGLPAPGATDRLMRLARSGGAPEALPAALDPDARITTLVSDGSTLYAVALGPRDAALTNEIILYAIDLAGLGTRRTSLGRTYLEGLVVALDANSVYFTRDGVPPGGPTTTPRTLQRSCLDGSNRVTLLEGLRYGDGRTASSVHAIALDSQRLYFTANNAVYTLDK